jgi:hypothetical protein
MGHHQLPRKLSLPPAHSRYFGPKLGTQELARIMDELPCIVKPQSGQALVVFAPYGTK